MQLKTKKASVLAVTLIILGVMLVTALSMSIVSIMERKASMSSNKSNLAYSRADNGVEITLQDIKNNDGGMISAIDTDCDGIIEPNDGTYRIELKNEEGLIMNATNISGYDCSSVEISEIDSIKSTGITDTNQRAVEVAVAAGAGFGEWDDTYDANIIYQAETDGFVLVYKDNASDILYGITDSNSTPTTIRTGDDEQSSRAEGIMFPVRKDDYWKVETGGGTSGVNVYWLPVNFD